MATEPGDRAGVVPVAIPHPENPMPDTVNPRRDDKQQKKTEKKKQEEKIEKKLDEGLKESMLTSDPVAIVQPSATHDPVKEKKSGQNLPGGKPDGTRDS
jgi:hypothetical protein